MRKQFTGEYVARTVSPGRRQYGTLEDVVGKLSLFQVDLRDGYDDGGCYWGSGLLALYCARDGGDNYRQFVRAQSREEARAAMGIPQSMLKKATSKQDRSYLGVLARRYILRPYGWKVRPFFTLCLYDRPGEYRNVGYSLSMGRKVLFHGTDFIRPACYPTDDVHTMEALMGFLCLRDGDVEDEYFDKYTVDQFEFRDMHAGAMSICVMDMVARKEDKAA